MNNVPSLTSIMYALVLAMSSLTLAFICQRNQLISAMLIALANILLNPLSWDVGYWMVSCYTTYPFAVNSWYTLWLSPCILVFPFVVLARLGYPIVGEHYLGLLLFFEWFFVESAVAYIYLKVAPKYVTHKIAMAMVLLFHHLLSLQARFVSQDLMAVLLISVLEKLQEEQKRSMKGSFFAFVISVLATLIHPSFIGSVISLYLISLLLKDKDYNTPLLVASLSSLFILLSFANNDFFGRSVLTLVAHIPKVTRQSVFSILKRVVVAFSYIIILASTYTRLRQVAIERKLSMFRIHIVMLLLLGFLSSTIFGQHISGYLVQTVPVMLIYLYKFLHEDKHLAKVWFVAALMAYVAFAKYYSNPYSYSSLSAITLYPRLTIVPLVESYTWHLFWESPCAMPSKVYVSTLYPYMRTWGINLIRFSSPPLPASWFVERPWFPTLYVSDSIFMVPGISNIHLLPVIATLK